jgi:hypothetical protein
VGLSAERAPRSSAPPNLCDAERGALHGSGATHDYRKHDVQRPWCVHLKARREENDKEEENDNDEEDTPCKQWNLS